MWIDVAQKTPTKSRVYNNLANGMADAGLFDKAIEAYNAALSIEPKMEQAIYSLGVTYGKMGLTDKARNQYVKAIIVDYNYPEAHMNLGNIYKEEGVKLQQELRAKTNISESLKQSAIQEINTKFRQAEKEYKVAIKQNPGYGECYSNLGVLFAMFKKYDLAEENYNLAKKFNPRFAPTYSNAAAMYGTQGMYKEAMRELKTALLLDPNHSDAIFNLALTYLNLKDMEKAKAVLRDLIQRFPDHARGRGLYNKILENEAKQKK